MTTRAGDAAAAPAIRAAVLRAELDAAPRLGEAFARDALHRAAQRIDDAPEPLIQVALLERALLVASHFDEADLAATLVRQLVARFERLMAVDRNPANFERISSLLARSFHGLRRLGLHEPFRDLLDRLTEIIQAAEETARAGARTAAQGVSPERAEAERRALTLSLMLPLAAARHSFDETDQALAAFDEAEQLLETNSATPAERAMHPAYAVLVARQLAAACGVLDTPVAVQRLERVFSLRRFHVPSQTDAHFSASMLAIVEAALLAIAGEHATLDPATRHWLDESEYLVRRRIHRDVRSAMAEAGGAPS